MHICLHMGQAQKLPSRNNYCHAGTNIHRSSLLKMREVLQQVWNLWDLITLITKSNCLKGERWQRTNTTFWSAIYPSPYDDLHRNHVMLMPISTNPLSLVQRGRVLLQTWILKTRLPIKENKYYTFIYYLLVSLWWQDVIQDQFNVGCIYTYRPTTKIAQTSWPLSWWLLVSTNHQMLNWSQPKGWVIYSPSNGGKMWHRVIFNVDCNQCSTVRWKMDTSFWS